MPASVTTRVAPTDAPSRAATCARSSNSSAPPSPAPPAMIRGASPKLEHAPGRPRRARSAPARWRRSRASRRRRLPTLPSCPSPRPPPASVRLAGRAHRELSHGRRRADRLVRDGWRLCHRAGAREGASPRTARPPRRWAICRALPSDNGRPVSRQPDRAGEKRPAEQARPGEGRGRGRPADAGRRTTARRLRRPGPPPRPTAPGRKARQLDRSELAGDPPFEQSLARGPPPRRRREARCPPASASASSPPVANSPSLTGTTASGPPPAQHDEPTCSPSITAACARLGATQSPARLTVEAGLPAGAARSRARRPARPGTASTTQSTSRLSSSPVGWWSSWSAAGVGADDDAVGRLADPLLGRPHLEALEVERDAEILSHHHRRRDDLDRAAAVAQQLGDARRLVETHLVHDEHPSHRLDRAPRHGRRGRCHRGEHLGDVGDGDALSNGIGVPERASRGANRSQHHDVRASARSALPRLSPPRRARRSTASWRHSISWLRTRSPSSARFGTDAARRTWPPGSAARSSTVTRWPRLPAAMAACSPAGPAPTTTRTGPGRRDRSRRRRRHRLSGASRRPARPPDPWPGSRCTRATG